MNMAAAISLNSQERPEPGLPDGAGAGPAAGYARTGLLNCPVCGSRSTILSSQQVCLTMREYFMDCRNVLCGLRFKASMVFDYIIRPSSIQDDSLDLPVRIPTRAEVMAAADRRRDDPAADQTNIFDFLGGAPESEVLPDPP